MIDYLREEVGDDCDTLEGAYSGKGGDIHVAFSTSRLLRESYSDSVMSKDYDFIDEVLFHLVTLKKEQSEALAEPVTHLFE
jgi:hypothetical protein